MIAERARATRRCRLAWGAALLWLGLLGAALHLRPAFTEPPVRSAAMFRLAPGPDGPLVFHVNDFHHDAYPNNVAVVRAEARLRWPAWSAGDRPLIVENRLDVEVWPREHMAWPWPGLSPEQVIDPLRAELAAGLSVRLHGAPAGAQPPKPGWWDAPQRTILWREVLLTAASWLAWPLLAAGLYLVARRSRAERAFAKLGGRGICPRCDYDLTGARDRCPECGRPIAPGEQAVLPT